MLLLPSYHQSSFLKVIASNHFDTLSIVGTNEYMKKIPASIPSSGVDRYKTFD